MARDVRHRGVIPAAVGVDHRPACNIQFAIEPDTGSRDGGHRDEPAGVSRSSAPGVQGDRLPRSPRSPPGWAVGYNPRRDPQRHHRRRRPRRSSPSLDYGGRPRPPRFRRFEEVSPGAGRQRSPTHNEVGRRGDGDRPVVHGKPSRRPLRSLEKPEGALFPWAGVPLGRDELLGARSGGRTTDASSSCRQAVRAGGEASEEAVTRPPGSTRGSSTRSSRWDEIRRHRRPATSLDPDAAAARQAARASSDQPDSATSAASPPRVVRELAGHALGHPPVYLNRGTPVPPRFAARYALPVLLLRRGDRGPRAGDKTEGDHPWAAGRTGYRPGHRVRLLLAVHASFTPSPRPATRPSWSTATPRRVSTDYDTSDRL